MNKDKSKGRPKLYHIILSAMGISWALTCTIVMTLTFIDAYRREAKATIIYINKIGEADVELCLVTIGAILIVYTLVSSAIKFLRNHPKEKHTTQPKQKEGDK
jgi:hypothetical protein